MKSHFTNNIFLLFSLATLTHCADDSNKKVDETKQSEECCAKESSTAISQTSEITCPTCGHKKVETLPTDVCVIKYNCEQCNALLTPKTGDCCVFCTYGTHKCPSMQDL